MLGGFVLEGPKAKPCAADGLAEYHDGADCGFAPSLGGLGRPVLSGMYDFWIEWTPESNQAESKGVDTQPMEEKPILLAALRDQLWMCS
jgi:hypothetical protein